MKVLSFLFLIGLLCLAITFQTRSHHILDPDKYFSAVAECSTSDHGDEDDLVSRVFANVSADGVELGGYYISTSGIPTEPKSRRFCGSASASTSEYEKGFIHVRANCSIGGRFYDGQGDFAADWDEAGNPDEQR